MTSRDIQHIEEVYNDIKRRQQDASETAVAILSEARMAIEGALADLGYRIVYADGAFQIIEREAQP